MKILNIIRKKPILKETMWLVAARVYSMAIGMITSIMLVRYLGPDRNGFYNYIGAYVALFSGFSIMGLDNILIKEIAMNVRSNNDILSSNIIVRLLGSAFAFFLALVCLKIIGRDNILIYVCVYSILIFASNTFSGITSWYYAHNNARFLSLSQVFSHTIRVALTQLCIWFNQGIMVFLILNVFEAWLTTIIQWIAFFREKNHFSFQPSFDTCIHFIRQGFPIILGSIATTINFKIDQLMIGNILGDHELGIYSVAVRLAELWYFIPVTISTVLLPRLTVLKASKDEMSYKKTLQKYFSWLVLLAYGTGIVTVIFASPMIRLLFGKDYIASVPIVSIYIWAGIFINLSVIRGSWYVIEEQTSYSLYCNVIGAIVNVLLNMILIPAFGGIGAAYATFVSYLVYGYASSFIFKKLRPIGIMQTKALFLRGIRWEN